MNPLPSPDMTTWSILDYELAFDGVRQINDAAVWLQSQPRASGRDHNYRPGADFIVAIGEDWCSGMVDQMMNRLADVRFADAGAEDRRLRLLLHYHTSYGPAGDSLEKVLEMLEEWRKPKVN